MLHITKTLRGQKGIVAVAAVLTTSVFAMPVMASAATTNTTISSNVSSVISLLTSNGTVNVDVVPTGAGAQTIASDTVTVSTNDAAGYTLQLAETGASSTLTSGGNNISASAGTKASPVAMAANTWGYRVDGAGGFGAGATSAASSTAIGAATFAAVPATASPDTIKSTATSASSDQTTIWYGVATDSTQAPGTYTNSVTYTATPN